MKTEELTDHIRNLIWAVLLVAALILGIVRGHWFTFIFLAASFFVLKGTILIQLLRLRKAQNELKLQLKLQGRSSYIPNPKLIEAMTNRGKAIEEEINRLRPPLTCLRLRIDYGGSHWLFDSKLGGTPYWDSRLPYPTDAKGKPMAMVMQVNMEQMPHSELFPPTGMLQFFISADEEILENGYGIDYDNPTSQSNIRVVFHAQLDRYADPEQLAQYPRCETLKYAPVDGEYAIAAYRDESCINQTVGEFDALAAQAVKNLYGEELGERDVAGYVKGLLPEDIRDQVEDVLAVGDSTMFQGVTEVNFQILGFPAFEQFDPREKGSRYDTLLLQIPTIETGSTQEGNHRFRTIWGDCGSVRLFINSEALHQLDFSDVYCDFQCY